MKKLLLASTAIFCSGAALASDLPPRVSSKAAMAYAAAPPSFTWTGCYVGAHAGAGWSRTDFSDLNSNIASPGDLIWVNGGAGFIGGGQFGCDHQFANNWVVGVAGDFSWASIQGQGDDPFFTGKGGNPIVLKSRTDFLASATGRVGYAWDRYLLYVKGGAAWSYNKYEINNFIDCGFLGLFACNTNASDWRTGWTAGAGFEWAFAPNWSALLEYDHYGFASKDLTFTDSVNGPFTFTVKQDIDVVKLGINYRFGGLLR